MQHLSLPPEAVDLISDEHAEHLTNLIDGGLMRTNLPDDVEQHFLDMGYAKHAVGGLMATQAGHAALTRWQKDNAR